MDTLLIIDALDVDNLPITLRFSQQLTVDAAGNVYMARISAPAQLSISPNDGGVLAIFKTSSVGDISLINVDGGLDFLADTALDGRAAQLLSVDGVTETVRFEGTVARLSWQNDEVILSLRARQEALTEAHPLATYAGDNALPAGLEGTEETIGGTLKPKVFGDVRNIAPVLVNEALLIYQASSLSNCRITAVYDEGVRLADYYVQGAHSAGATTIALHWGVGAIPVGSELVFSNHASIYTVAVALSGGVLTLTSGLTAAVAAGAKVDVVNFYASTAALQLTNYLVNGDHTKGATTIALNSGTGAINAGDLLVFNSHAVVYAVVTDLAAGVVVLDSGLAEALSAGAVVSVLGACPAHWGAYQGYFRLTAPPSGRVTCDAVSIDGTGAVHQAGDVFALVAAEVGLSVDSASVAVFNAVGTLGLFVGTATPTLTLFNQLAASVFGFYTVVNTAVTLQLLQAPATPVLTLEDYQILSISRAAVGLGSNGLPVYRVIAKFDRIEATQAQVAGAVSNARRQRLALQYREAKREDAAVLTRHLLASVLTFESLLRGASPVNALLNRALNLVKPRRDVVDLTLDSTAIAWPALGDTVRVVSRYLGYSAGRDLVVIGYDIDDLNRTLTLRLFG